MPGYEWLDKKESKSFSRFLMRGQLLWLMDSQKTEKNIM